MKILHIITSINIGGAEKFCVDLCNTQSLIDDHEIYLCVLDSIDTEKPLLKILSKKVNLISLDKKGGYSLNIIFKIFGLLKKINPDIIHLNGRAIIYSSIPILLRRIKAIYTVHTFANKEYNKYFTSYNKFLFNFFPSIFTPVAISPTVQKTIKETYKTKHEQMIFNGSSPIKTTKSINEVEELITSFKKDKNTIVLTYIGRIAPEKNVLMLIQAFNKLIEENYNVLLLIIGYDTTLNEFYLPICKENTKFPNKIIFLGQKTNIADFLSFTNATCLTSNYEGLGIAALESFSLGIPVLSTPSGGPQDLITKNSYGLISDDISVNSYLSILKNFIEKNNYDREEIQNYYEENFAMKKCANNYLNLYKKIILGK
jgi:glycosyltransferase involved in cell wall biosynthesis